MKTVYPKKVLLNAVELREHCGMSLRMFRELLELGMPFVMVGKSKRFRVESVVRWLESIEQSVAS